MATINIKTFALLAVVIIGGCSSPEPFAAWEDPALADRVAEINRERPGPSFVAGLPRPDDALPDFVDDSWFTEETLQHNPQIRAARQRVERLRERVPQAIALPDPEASVTFGELAQTAAGQVDYIVAVRQSLPYPGTLEARGRVARQEVVEALYRLEVTINQVTADVQRAYWSYDGAVRETVVLREAQALLEQIESAVRSRIRFGRAEQADVLRVARERAALENRLSELAQRQRTAGAMLARLTSRNTPESWPTTDALNWEPLTYDAVQLRKHALSKHPDLAATQPTRHNAGRDDPDLDRGRQRCRA